MLKLVYNIDKDELEYIDITGIAQYNFGNNNFNGSGNILTTGTLGAGAITGTSFIIGANTLNTSEWAFLDGQDQAVKTTSSPTFVDITGTSFAEPATASISSFSTPPTTALRTSGTYAVGWEFKVTTNLTVSKLGRLYVAGNTQNHVAKIWDTTNTVTPVATGTILEASASDGNNFKWVDITPVTLSSLKTYRIAIDETNGGDAWKDTWVANAAVTANFINMVACYGTVSTYPSSNGSANNMFDTAAMWYATTPFSVNSTGNIFTPTDVTAATLTVGGTSNLLGIVGMGTAPYTTYWNSSQVLPGLTLARTDASATFAGSLPHLVLYNPSPTSNSLTQIVFGSLNTTSVGVGHAAIVSPCGTRTSGWNAGWLAIYLKSSASAAPTEVWRWTNSGNLSNTGADGTAQIHLKAGTATAGTAPLKFTSGTNLTSAEAGAMEYDGTDLYFTEGTPTRQYIAKSAGKGLSVTITTAQLTALGAQGSMTFVNGVLTAQTAAT